MEDSELDKLLNQVEVDIKPYMAFRDLEDGYYAVVKFKLIKNKHHQSKDKTSQKMCLVAECDKFVSIKFHFQYLILIFFLYD